MPKVQRELQQLISALRKHLSLLREYAQRAYEEGETEYLGEIAGKLRLLVYESRTNRPLLLALLDRYGVEIPIPIDTPITAHREVDLRQYLRKVTSSGLMPDGRTAPITRVQLIRDWAQQLGAAHEDWSTSEEFLANVGKGTLDDNTNFMAELLKRTTEVVLYVGDYFLKTLDGGAQPSAVVTAMNPCEPVAQQSPDSNVSHLPPDRAIFYVSFGRLDGDRAADYLARL